MIRFGSTSTGASLFGGYGPVAFFAPLVAQRLANSADAAAAPPSCRNRRRLWSIQRIVEGRPFGVFPPRTGIALYSRLTLSPGLHRLRKAIPRAPKYFSKF